jgi:uncharacterized membrane protein YdjX (TVP38/TMEM64 family)
MPTPSSGSIWVRFALLLVLLAVGLAVTAVVGVPTIDDVRAAVYRLGAAGVVGFVVVYALYTLVFLPKGVLSAAGGLLYGLAVGVALVWVGAMLGAVLAFWLGRVLGRDAVARLTGGHVDGFDQLVARHGILAVLFVRMVPVIPFTAVNYGAGLTALTMRSYLLGTAVGMLPGTVAYVALGAYGTDPGSWEFASAVGAFLLLSIAGGVVALRARRASADTTPTSPAEIGVPDGPPDEGVS